MDRSIRFAGTVVSLACAMTLLAADGSDAETNEAAGDGTKVVARYAGRTFTDQDFLKAARKLNPRSRRTLEDAERRKTFIENNILSELIYAEGVSKGIDKDPAVLQQIEDLERQLIVQKVMQEYQSAPVSDDDIRAHYDTNIATFTTDRVKSSHILVAEEALAKEVHAKLVADPAQFADLAKEHSTDRSNAERGGDLGFFAKGRMVKEFEEAAFALTEDGQITEPVKTRFGYHIIQRTGREDGEVRPFDQVKNQIKVKLVNEARREKTQEFLDKLKADAGLEVDEAAVAALEVPLRDKGGDEHQDAGIGGH